MNAKSVLANSDNLINPLNGKLNSFVRCCWEEILLEKYRLLILKGNCFYWQILI